MARDDLRIEIDEPGRRLVLGRAAPSFPVVGFVMTTLGILASVAAAVWWSPALLVAMLLIGTTAGLAARRASLVVRLVFDRSQDLVQVVSAGPFGGMGASRSRQASRLPTLQLEALMPPPSPPRQAVRFRLRAYGSGWSRYATRFTVEAVDTLAEADDLCHRIASASGLEYARVVRSDPRERTRDLSATAAPGFLLLPEATSRADYSREPLSPLAARAPSEAAPPPFDPASFKADFQVAVWKPGREVRFRRSLGLPAIVCWPGVLLVFAGPVAFVTSGRFDNTMSGRVLVAFVAGGFGLIFAGVSAIAVYTSLPRTIVFDWAARRLRITGLFSRREHDFSEIRAVGLMSQRMKTQSRGGTTNVSYYGEVSVLLCTPGVEPGPYVLLATPAVRADAQAPYHACLPLVTELADALEVPRDLGNYGKAEPTFGSR